MQTSQEIQKPPEVDENIKKAVEECLSLITDNKLVQQICDIVIKVLSEKNKLPEINSEGNIGNEEDA